MDVEEVERSYPFKTEEEEAAEIKFRWIETVLFCALTMLMEVFIVVIFAVWFDYPTLEDADFEFDHLYYLYRDVAIMIFVGFGYLMVSTSPPGPHVPPKEGHFILLMQRLIENWV